MSTPAEDRLLILLAQGDLTGIDFIYVYETQDRLDVYFLRPPDTLTTPLPGTITASDILIENIRDDDQPDVTITGLSWAVVDGRTVLRLDVIRPDSFADHQLTIQDARIDPFYNGKVFNFQANCETGLDCEPEDLPPLPEDYVDFPVEYTARDFLSIRQALLDFASQRYPHWLDRLEADVGVMLTEVLSALGDEMAYFQDRINREAYLESASQRQSLRQLARLVDYEIFDGQAASTWLDVTVNPTESGIIPVGTRVASNDSSVIFEIGRGLRDDSGGYAVDSARNSFDVYFWDEDDVVLAEGATQIDVVGHVAAALPPVTGGRLILLSTNPADQSDPAVRLLLRLINIQEGVDTLTGTNVTRLTWAEPTPYRIAKTEITLRGNIVPVTAGETLTKVFSIGAVSAPTAPVPERVIVRAGANGVPVYRSSLNASDQYGIAWLQDDISQHLKPEIRLYRATEVAGEWQADTEEWEWVSSFLGEASSTQQDRHFTLEDGLWGRIVGYPIPGDVFVHDDYISSLGRTIRFGDGEFGLIPPEGLVFIAYYRIDTGSNIPRNTLTQLLDNVAFIERITNPIAAVDARMGETVESMRLNAPQAFRSITYRAVRPEDYSEAAERLEWVQRAGSAMRWTGSWLTVFTSTDPRNATTISPERRGELADQIDRFRQAGQDAQQRPPHYADIDIELTVCAKETAYPGDVREALLEILVGANGFFCPENFTFGTLLYRGSLEATAQSAYGVKAVEKICFRRRGYFDWKEFSPFLKSYNPGIDNIIRVENNPVYPERGILTIIVKGGA